MKNSLTQMGILKRQNSIIKVGDIRDLIGMGRTLGLHEVLIHISKKTLTDFSAKAKGLSEANCHADTDTLAINSGSRRTAPVRCRSKSFDGKSLGSIANAIHDCRG